MHPRTDRHEGLNSDVGRQNSDANFHAMWVIQNYPSVAVMVYFAKVITFERPQQFSIVI